MKKKILGIVVTLTLVLTMALGLSACGDGKKISLSIAEFNDDGVLQICINGIPSGTSTAEDYDSDTPITRQKTGSLYWYNPEGDPQYVESKWDKGKWEALVEIWIGSNGRDVEFEIGDLKVEFGGQEIELVRSDTLEGQIYAAFFGFIPSSDRYYAHIDEISSDTQIKLVGHTQALS